MWKIYVVLSDLLDSNYRYRSLCRNRCRSGLGGLSGLDGMKEMSRNGTKGQVIMRCRA